LRLTIIILLFAFSLVASSQPLNRLVQKGNEFYKMGDFYQAQTQYEKALLKDQNNTIAQFNAGNALQKQKNFTNAAKMYQSVFDHTTDTALLAKSAYNKGIAEVKQNKLNEGINAFKDALRKNPLDNEARENLQKAVNELKKQNQQKPKSDPKKQEPPPEKKKEKKEEQPKSNMNKEQAENLLSQLRQQEKHLQELQKEKIRQQTPSKDW